MIVEKKMLESDRNGETSTKWTAVSELEYDNADALSLTQGLASR